MSKHWLAGALLALAAASSHADPQSTYQWMVQNQILSSTSLQNGQAVAAIGSQFYTGSTASQQNLCATLLLYFQQQDATVQQFTLVDPATGKTVGSFANGALSFSSN